MAPNTNSITVEAIDAAYGAVRVLENVSLRVGSGETVVLLGTNGNGKSTLMKCIMGMVRPTQGSVLLTIDGTIHDLTRLSTEEIVNLGVAMVPEGRRLFPRLTVEAVASRRLDPRPLYTHTFPLERLDEALDATRIPAPQQRERKRK